MPTGEKLYVEQLSHRPGNTGFLLEDPDQDYTFSGYHELKGWLQGPTSFGGSRFGVWKLKFKDGVEYRFKSNPICVVGGLLKGP